MERLFRIERQSNISRDKWWVCLTEACLETVEEHYRRHHERWNLGEFRLFELKPMSIGYKTVLEVKELN